jgi:fluoroquinolone resistance protein
MSSLQLILDHDKWRKGTGGAAAGVVAESDANAYAGLDLDLITLTSSRFTGSRFASTTFHDAVWTDCQFTGCTLTDCDMQGITMTGCTFVDCTFGETSLKCSKLTDCTFTQCSWTTLNFDSSHWAQVKLLDCQSHSVTATDLMGHQVDFTGSRFEDMQLVNARIN